MSKKNREMLNGKRVIRWSDPLNDDFADNDITQSEVGEDFTFIHKSPLWRLAEFFVYYAVALPAVWLICKVGFGLRVKNRKAIRKAGKAGFFLYGNHTSFSDAYIAPIVSFPKKAFIIANPDAVSIPGIRGLVQMLGCIPIPTERRAMPRFTEAVYERIREGSCVMIYPEAHIWPYYTKIRPFTASSFHYQAKLGVPAVPMTMTYRNRKLFGLIKLNRPGMTLHIGEPVFPDPELTERERRQKLRDEVYEQMKTVSDSTRQYEHIIYIEREREENEA